MLPGKHPRNVPISLVYPWAAANPHSAALCPRSAASRVLCAPIPRCLRATSRHAHITAPMRPSPAFLSRAHALS
eukprot:6994724-Prymnesium_polylepis.1